MNGVSPIRRSLVWFFTDASTGKIVIAQWPNLTLWIFIVAWGAGLLVPPGRIATVLAVVAGVALALWAVDEIVRGSCPFRRVLGATVLLYEATRWL